jgi:hypothetical protein
LDHWLALLSNEQYLCLLYIIPWNNGEIACIQEIDKEAVIIVILVIAAIEL